MLRYELMTSSISACVKAEHINKRGIGLTAHTRPSPHRVQPVTAVHSHCLYQKLHICTISFKECLRVLSRSCSFGVLAGCPQNCGMCLGIEFFFIWCLLNGVCFLTAFYFCSARITDDLRFSLFVEYNILSMILKLCVHRI